jgi:hypothetical protein
MMQLGSLDATLARRVLVNYAADPEVVEPLLPAPLRPMLVGGDAVVGICFVQLTHARPHGLPATLGVRCEAAAHRVAVEWGPHDAVEHGVYVLRRDTSSLLTRLAGGRLFAGVHQGARFEAVDGHDRWRIAYQAHDGTVGAEVDATLAPATSSRLFRDLDEASAFFRLGAVGWSPTRRGGLEGLRLDTRTWSLEALRIEHVRSSFYDDHERFPSSAIQLDSAFLMRGLRTRWSAVAPNAIVAVDAVSARR